MTIQVTTKKQNTDQTRPKGVGNQMNKRTPPKLATMSQMGFTKVKSTRMK